MLRTWSFVIHRAESRSSFPFAGLSARSQRDAFTVSIHSCKQSIVCGILLWSAPLFPLGLEALLYMGAVLRSRLVRGFLEYILTLSLASFVEFALLRYVGIPGRRLVVEYVRTDTWKNISAPGLEGDGHGVTEHVVATCYMAMFCTVPLTPCVGCHFKPGAIPHIFNRVSDSPRWVSESLGGRDSPPPHDTVSDSVAGATCSSYLTPSWVGASGLVMIQSGRHPKDWLSGGTPTPSTNSTGVLSRLIRCLVCFFSASVVDDGGIDKVRQLLLFLPPGSPFSGAFHGVHGQAQEPLCRPQR